MNNLREVICVSDISSQGFLDDVESTWTAVTFPA